MPWNRPLPTFIAAILLFALGPVMALAPRGMPVWFLALAAVAGWGMAAARRRPPAIDRVVALAAAGLTAWIWVGVLWSPSPRAALTALEITYVMAGVYLIWGWMSGLPAEMEHRLLPALAGGLGLGFALCAVETTFDYPLYQWWHGERPLEWMAASNVPKRAAALLALAVWPATRIVARLHPGRGWSVALPAIAAGLAALTTSRSALFGVTAGLAAYFPAIAGQANGVRRALQGIVVAAFVLAIPAGLALEPLAAGLPDDGYFRSALHRLEIWRHAAARALEAPVAGHGVDASRVLPIRDETSRFAPLTNSLLPLHPHNAFLQIWLELGAVGALLAGLLLTRLLSRIAGLDPAAAPAALGYALTALALASSAYGVWQAWWMCGLAATGVLLLALAAPARPARDDSI